MAFKHGTLSAYNNGCRCADCVERNASYRQQRRNGSDIDAGQVPGPVESGVREEIGLAVESRPGLAAVAVCLAQLLDNPQGRNQWAAAAKVLAGLLDTLSSVSARGSHGRLALVRNMSDRAAVLKSSEPERKCF